MIICKDHMIFELIMWLIKIICLVILMMMLMDNPCFMMLTGAAGIYGFVDAIHGYSIERRAKRDIIRKLKYNAKA